MRQVKARNKGLYQKRKGRNWYYLVEKLFFLVLFFVVVQKYLLIFCIGVMNANE